MVALPMVADRPMALAMQYLSGIYARCFYKTTQDETLAAESRDTGRTIKGHLYKSKSFQPDKPNPILLNFHGSGFVADIHGSDEAFCRLVADETEYSVLDFTYRLAPQNQWPAALDDAEDVVKWILAHPERFDLERICISGFSAGGNLALICAGGLFPKDTFRAIMVFYPVVDFSKGSSPRVAPDTTGPPLPHWMTRMFDSAYLPKGQDRTHPHLSPLYLPVDGFPAKVLMITAAHDNLCTDAETLAEKMKATSGREVILHRCEKCEHGFDKSPWPGEIAIQATKDTYEMVLEMIRRV